MGMEDGAGAGRKAKFLVSKWKHFPILYLDMFGLKARVKRVEARRE